jgi:hypothetical protein
MAITSLKDAEACILRPEQSCIFTARVFDIKLTLYKAFDIASCHPYLMIA